MIRYSLVTLAVCASAFAATPKGLSTSAWSSIRSEYQRHRQAAFPVEGGWQARNYGQDWSTFFDGRGFEVRPQHGAWRWGLRLASYGYRGQQRRVDKARAVAVPDVEKFSYQWDSVIREWYVNGAGLEHGYTLASRPGNGVGLQLHLDVLGTLQARVSGDGQGVAFLGGEGGPVVLNYGGLKVTDATGRLLASRFYGEAGGLRLEIDDAGARYPVTVDPIAQQQAYLKASNVGADDRFGSSVAVSGDTVVVGAPGESSGNGSNQADNSATQSGAAYVFTRTGAGDWTQQAYLKASNVERNDIFGWSVAVSADTLLVGAPGEASGNGNQADNSANNSGAAYVFTRANGVWTQQAYMKASNVGAGDEFGHSVAVTGDTVVVGAPKEDSSSPNQGALFVAESGAAYVFTRSSGVWTRQAHLKASNPGRDEFGWSVAVSGDTVVVGAPGEDSGNASDQADNSAADSGAAYVFTRTGGVWSQQAYLKASNVDANDQFGRSVAVSGDTVVVGTYWEAGNGSNQADDSAPQSGAAYVFTVYPAQAVSLDVPKQIPDNSFAGLASVLTITDPAIVADLNLTLSLNHPCLASLDVSLTPPGGTPVKLLVSQNGLMAAAVCGKDFDVTTLDDQAPRLLTNGSSPGYTGSFNVNHASVGDNPLAKFNGMLAAGVWTLTVADRAVLQTGTLVAWGLAITPATAPPPNTTGLRFVPVTPCRLVDTREASLGAFGTPALVAGATRSFVIPQKTSCGIPATAAAYSINLTVVPKGPLSYVTIWPTGAAQPLVSTLNSPDGRIKANAALVPAGASGAISVFANNATELVLDINGYFIDPAVNPQALAFYPLPPCRILDTRNPNGSLGGPVIPGGSRDVPILSSNCGVPASAQAYSLNATVVPSGPLGYLTLWPTGAPQPLVSTLNALTGGIVANAAIVPTGTSGSISAFVTSTSHLVLDINGYFAPPGAANAQRFFTVTPCRLLDTRNPIGEFGGLVLAAGSARSYRLPLVTSCGLPATATAYSLNATVVPASLLSYLTLWPFGTAQPLVSTLNALDDAIVANAAIVPAGTAGAVASFVTNQTHLILDTNGFFAP